MNTLELKSIRELVLRSNEKIYQGENKIVSFDVVLPEKIGDYATAECNIEMRCYLGDNYIPFEISTASRKTSTKVTSDITETAQTVQILFYITHGDDVIGKTNKVDLIVCETKAGTPIDPRSEFDEIIRQQRATIAEQAETISEQATEIEAKDGQISELNDEITEKDGQITELNTENTRLENLTDTQRETIQHMIDNPPEPELYTPPEPIIPENETRVYTPPQDYDGFASFTVTGTSYMNIDLQKWVSPSPNDEPFEMIFETTVRSYIAYNQTKMIKATILTATSIEPCAFYSCTGLQSVVFPASLISIEPYAFYSCTGLQSVVFPASLISIGNNAFDKCASLTRLTLPDSLTSISWSAFLGCTSLTELTLPDSLTSIGNHAFHDCTSLTRLTLAQGFNCNNLNLSASTRFTAETIVACLEALADRTGQTAYTITFGSKNLNKLTAEQRAIATNKNWNLA